jgi:translation elongation factor EF-Tu-like GTPase
MVLRIMGADSWEYVVEEAFSITGRGTGVFGTLRGLLEEVEAPANLIVGDEVQRIERVTCEIARWHGADRQALLLHGVFVEQVPAGSKLIGPVE